MVRIAAGLTLLFLNSVFAAEPAHHLKAFDLRSSDGGRILGQADLSARPVSTAVIMVAGSGLFDRDVLLGASGTGRDRVFKDLAMRIVREGATTVRYDKRGVRYGVTGTDRLDFAQTGKMTTNSQVEDLRAVYEWTRASGGLGAKCVVIFVHSEGTATVGRLAASGSPQPDLLIGMGALMESPLTVLQWQMSERDAYSLERMDLDRDGNTTNEEIRQKWRDTPAGTAETLEAAKIESIGPLLNPAGRWTAEDIADVRRKQKDFYEDQRRSALAYTDDSPWPDAEHPAASAQWWKNWFNDDQPVAKNLRAWNMPISLHYGAIDSQTNVDRQFAAARQYLTENELRIEVLPHRGHTLGESPAIGPMDQAAADRIAHEAASACKVRAHPVESQK